MTRLQRLFGFVTYMNSIQPATHYLPSNDLWVVTSYYNPAGYQTKRLNYDRFAAPLIEAGIHLLTVECAFGRAPFELPPSPQVLQVRTHDVLWLKERLLNLAIAHIPPQAKKVAWVDADILFANPAWAVETSAQLDRWPIVQPCDSVGRMERGQLAYAGKGRRSFAYQLQLRPESALLRASAHGQPGIAWAARRSLIAKHGLYDAAIMDGGDELFSHALGAGFNSPCVRKITGARHGQLPKTVDRLLNRLARIAWPRPLANWYITRTVIAPPRPVLDERFFAHYLEWAQLFYADVRGQVGFVPGMALHLWHGDMINRQYKSRNAILKRHCFDPAHDLQLNEQGVWEWASHKPAMHQEVRDYFHTRLEDGSPVEISR